MTARSNAADDRTACVAAGALLDRWIRTPLSALSFWGAIALPVLYLPLLVGGPDTDGGLVALLGLLGLHVLALFGGRKYDPGKE